MKKRLIFAVIFSIILVFSACSQTSKTTAQISEIESKNSALESKVSKIESQLSELTSNETSSDSEISSESNETQENTATELDYKAIVKDIMATGYNVDMDNLTPEQKDSQNFSNYVDVDYNVTDMWKPSGIKSDLHGFIIFYKLKFIAHFVIFETKEDFNSIKDIVGKIGVDRPTETYIKYPYALVVATDEKDTVLNIIKKYVDIE